jgi:hypothetical protein
MGASGYNEFQGKIRSSSSSPTPAQAVFVPGLGSSDPQHTDNGYRSVLQDPLVY